MSPQYVSRTTVREHSRKSKRGRVGSVRQHSRAVNEARQRAQEEKYEREHEVIGGVTMFTPYGVDHASIYANGEPSDYFNAAFRDFAKAASTDPWRSHFEIPDHVGEYVRVLDTWVSPMGHLGDQETMHRVPIESLYKRWKSGDRPPFPVAVVMLRTSNLFSLGFEMFVRKRDEAQMRRLLLAEGIRE